MAFIPTTAVRLLTGVPLSYKNGRPTDQIDFASVTAQYNYFAGKAAFSYNECTYQREKRAIKVPTNAEELHTVNYLMWQNFDYGGRWMYAYITEVEYANENMSYVHFEIDPFQTFMFDYSLLTCFTEREHVADDTIGAHTVPEGLETGPYISTSEGHYPAGSLNLYWLAAEDLTGGALNKPGIVGGMMIPCYWGSLGDVNDFAADVVETYVKAYADQGKIDSIIGFFTAPVNLVSTQHDVRQETWTMASRSLSFTPRNNKMYTYPYVCLAAQADGQGQIFRYELFSGAPTSLIHGGFGMDMEAVATPRNYQGQQLYTEGQMSLSSWPIGAFIKNSYENWIAQHKSRIAATIQNSKENARLALGGAIASVFALNVNGAFGGASQVQNAENDIRYTMAMVEDMSVIPDQMVGSATAADINSVANMRGFFSYCRSIRPEYGHMIDDYFTMYGYKVNAMKVPERKSRESWNYVKTVGCKISGGVPAEYADQIIAMYDNGITIWHGDWVGDYSRSNGIV